jgi:hypothetical protein
MTGLIHGHGAFLAGVVQTSCPKTAPQFQPRRNFNLLNDKPVTVKARVR